MAFSTHSSSRDQPDYTTCECISLVLNPHRKRWYAFLSSLCKMEGWYVDVRKLWKNIK